MRPFSLSQIYLYDQSVDIRKSFEGLGQLIEDAFPGKLLTGSLFLFLNRRRNLIKILYWEGDGFASGINDWNRAPSQPVFVARKNCHVSNSQCFLRASFRLRIVSVFLCKNSN